MEKKKGLVFDSQRYFGKFLKYEFKNNFEFDSYKNTRNFDDSVEGYNVVVFMIYSDNELVDMMQLYRRGVPLILCCLDGRMKLKLKKVKDVFLLDCDKVKAEMRLELGLCINSVA
ncbi:hypothetical protein [Flavobacterium sp. WG21]|uniref:hypothetical protein n=1 Tax=Flavobacterium sp. WG21 TaxID=1229487 RepID=UPI00034C410B|nr:hypothetical protein [Flavobacterium sp. WG21]